MSFYTDWFIAEEAEAENLATSGSPYIEWPSLSLKGIGEIDLMALWALLRGQKEDSAEEVSKELLFQGSEQGPFIVRVAPGFIELLSLVSDAHRSEIANAWSQSDGLIGLESSNVIEIVIQLSDFARRSRRDSKPILGMFAL
ncbi:hypothetical protein IAD21_04535 [Abditibacteriota bacterium]|nr:hypothetical protein IAD21_04535 [Abditibacteriota bacterium]